ncbi:ATP-binding protein [Microbacterium telephonicum]|uniref:Phage shock protein C (PspC) family protein n=1 Tax=Microbacterium telephonicum TaxID=1714841 RepID=A0A498BW08_9MICO|nr:ATP-binding protein [Microbacterium telephonicum]RLK47884.1 phage shock protein C (PspC) family protein [Microbacterium telephonicum]
MSPSAAPPAPAPSAPTSRPAAGPRPRPPVRPAVPRPALQLPRECVVTGVSAGLARHLGVRVEVVRTLFVVLGLCSGAGVLLYVWCWALTPREVGQAAVTRSAPVAWILVAAAGAALVPMAIASSDPWGQWWIVAPPFLQDVPAMLAVTTLAAVVLAVAAGMWAALVDRTDPGRGPRHAATVRIAASVVLVVAFLIPLRRLAVDALPIVFIALLPVVGLIALLSTTLIERWRELSGERVGRIREEQRAEMAAHLHDSVLQTLALIQNRSGASSEVARLARAQERELRAWLYDGDQPADSDLPTDLRDYAGALELDYPVRIDVVSAGLSTERASGELAAAAREAMLNAARHAGGEVSVYIEGGAGGVDVYIRDRGDGFDVDAVPDDRLGVRQSILGRMRRAGGTAAVRSSDAGTEVHLHFGTVPVGTVGAEGGTRG